MAHTPGPFVVYDWAAFGGNGYEVEAPSSQQMVGQVYHQTDAGEERANADLFAAAPDLLTACESLIDVFGYVESLAGEGGFIPVMLGIDWRARLAAARATINAAKGVTA